MNWTTISGNPFFTVALPLILTFVFSTWFSTNAQNRRIDDLRDAINKRFDGVDKKFDGVDKRFDGVDRRLERIEAKLDNHAERIAKLEGPALIRG
jgi:tetrahydromethanopterin S-methyltransferase subunit G